MNAGRCFPTTLNSRKVTVDASTVKYLHRISIGANTLQADEQIEVGGQGAAPNSYELLLAALGTCVGTALQLHADRRDWFLGQIHIDLTYRRSPLADCGECDTVLVLQEEIDVTISLPEDLSADQKAELLQAARECPMHRTLRSSVDIRLTIVEHVLAAS